RDATAYVNGPRPVREVTGLDIDPGDLGGATVHDRVSGVATLIAEDEDDCLLTLADLLTHLPDNHLDEPPRHPTSDPVDRDAVAGGLVPTDASHAYDVRDVIADVVDHDSFFELRPDFAPNIVTAY